MLLNNYYDDTIYKDMILSVTTEVERTSTPVGYGGHITHTNRAKKCTLTVKTRAFVNYLLQDINSNSIICFEENKMIEVISLSNRSSILEQINTDDDISEVCFYIDKIIVKIRSM